MMATITAVVAVASATTAVPPAQRGLSGEWVLDVARSDLAAEHPTSDYAVTLTLAWDGVELTQAEKILNGDFAGFKQSQTNIRYTIVVDGVEHPISGLNRILVLPSKTQAVARWEGNNLVIKLKGSDPLGSWSGERRYFLSDGGNELIQVRRSSSAINSDEQRLLFKRTR